MDRFLYILIVFVAVSCNTEDGSDCFISDGNTSTINYDLDAFSKVILHENIEVEIKQGEKNSIQITYGENLINNISTSIVDDKLSIRNTTSCSLIRDIEPAKIVITAINLSEIRNASQYRVFSNEILSFDSLTLISENAEINYINVGDFNLKIENQNLSIISNNVSNFIINGTTTNLFVGFYAGTGKFEGENLTSQNINIFHRGINEMIVNPMQQITGQIRGSGNVIAINRPPIVDVTEYYTGRLIFRD